MHDDSWRLVFGKQNHGVHGVSGFHGLHTGCSPMCFWMKKDPQRSPNPSLLPVVYARTRSSECQLAPWIPHRRSWGPQRDADSPPPLMIAQVPRLWWLPSDNSCLGSASERASSEGAIESSGTARSVNRRVFGRPDPLDGFLLKRAHLTWKGLNQK